MAPVELLAKSRVVKRYGVWRAYSANGQWLGDSSYWTVALAIALGESVNDALPLGVVPDFRDEMYGDE